MLSYIASALTTIIDYSYSLVFASPSSPTSPSSTSPPSPESHDFYKALEATLKEKSFKGKLLQHHPLDHEEHDYVPPDMTTRTPSTASSFSEDSDLKRVASAPPAYGGMKMYHPPSIPLAMNA
ncbi:uncharacterized protein SPPG_06118 [Spizellomyces punctatus DAOM BR117]|uniref:Uncharacterized protein n=1 Tax=Spizellomyces punctatus (strain DAOM BR117) TaxID=645134 RepID=A0A0L0HC05_SPIPD|nr:uncharacterized protein SPPG_06118 [Spizellomyces punctatus DAOM BR117]KNC98414.1 hypothetical protein SPPG_06118 [Spizellomyces punctatus DAOM BR117]|eukprot:XP_016606454.1 hypothetical protein SPPG_06118 [Spizellomyces punctatus DAOM BR117]